MNDDIFITTSLPEYDALKKAKEKLIKLKELPETDDTLEKLTNIQDAINFIESDKDGMAVFRRLYNPSELDNGLGELILWLQYGGNPNVDLGDSKKVDLKNVLYASSPSEDREFYIERTNIPNFYMWYETGATSEESFGTVYNDVFMGLIYTPDEL